MPVSNISMMIRLKENFPSYQICIEINPILFIFFLWIFVKCYIWHPRRSCKATRYFTVLYYLTYRFSKITSFIFYIIKSFEILERKTIIYTILISLLLSFPALLYVKKIYELGSNLSIIRPDY